MAFLHHLMTKKSCSQAKHVMKARNIGFELMLKLKTSYHVAYQMKKTIRFMPLSTKEI